MTATQGVPAGNSGGATEQQINATPLAFNTTVAQPALLALSVPDVSGGDSSVALRIDNDVTTPVDSARAVRLARTEP